MHKRAHDEGIRERRGNIITIRGLYVHSHTLRVSGICDVVEFHANAAGHPLHGEQGLWVPYPVEYKRGKSKSSDVDRLQLCAQAICLEEMFGSDIAEGALYYGKTHSREIVPLDTKLKSQVFEMCKEMHSLYLCLATVFSTFWLPGSDNLAKEPPMSQISAFPSIKALSILLLVPLNSTSLPWWTTLSIIAEASLSSPRIVPHLLNSMLVVNTTLRFS